MEDKSSLSDSIGTAEFDEDKENYPGYVLDELHRLLEGFSDEQALQLLRRFPANTEAQTGIKYSLDRLQRGFNHMVTFRLRLQLKVAKALVSSSDFSVTRELVRHCTEVLQKRVYSNSILKNVFLANLSGNVVRKRLMPKPLLLVGPPGTGKMNFCYAAAEGLRRGLVIVDLYASDNSRGGPSNLVKGIAKYGKNLLIVIASNGINRLIKYDPPGEITNSFFSRFFLDPFLQYPIDISMIPKILISSAENIVREDRFRDCRPAPTDRPTEEQKIFIAQKFIVPRLLAFAEIKTPVNFDSELVAAVVRRHPREPGLKEIERDLDTLVAVAGFRALKSSAKVVEMRLPDLELIFSPRTKSTPASNALPPDPSPPIPEDEADIPPEFSRCHQ